MLIALPLLIFGLTQDIKGEGLSAEEKESIQQSVAEAKRTIEELNIENIGDETKKIIDDAKKATFEQHQENGDVLKFTPQQHPKLPNFSTCI